MGREVACEGCEEFLKLGGLQAEKYPNGAFVFYYLHGRDAVASDLVQPVLEEIMNEVNGQPELFGGDASEHEREIFWGIVGLMESGKIAEAVTYIRDFRPADPRLLLALHLGAFFIANLRISKSEQKTIAKNICERIEPKIKFLVGDVVREFDGYLLELKDGEIVARDPKKNELGNADGETAANDGAADRKAQD